MVVIVKSRGKEKKFKKRAVYLFVQIKLMNMLLRIGESLMLIKII